MSKIGLKMIGMVTSDIAGKIKSSAENQATKIKSAGEQKLSELSRIAELKRQSVENAKKIEDFHEKIFWLIEQTPKEQLSIKLGLLKSIYGVTTSQEEKEEILSDIIYEFISLPINSLPEHLRFVHKQYTDYIESTIPFIDEYISVVDNKCPKCSHNFEKEEVYCPKCGNKRICI